MVNEKLFLDDIPVKTTKNDKFKLEHISEIIFDRIKQTSDSVLHIGLFGEWGAGKSSVVELLKKEILKKPYKSRFDIKFISLWKHASSSEALHRRIISDLIYELDINLEVDNSPDDTKTLTIETKRSGLYALEDKIVPQTLFFIYIFTILLNFLTNFGFSIINNILISTPTVLFITFFNTLIKNTNIIKSNKSSVQKNPFRFNSQFEEKFEEIIAIYKKKNRKEKLILVFEDLDRLDFRFLLPVLMDIKTYFNSKDCVYIIPFDDNQLLKYFKNKKQNAEAAYLCKSCLEKIFNFFIRLPKLEQSNFHDYVNKISLDLKWYNFLKDNRKESLPEVISILLHGGIETPRQVKQILNSFANDWYLAQKRDNDNKILTPYPESLAFFTVLKHSFPSIFRIIQNDTKILRDFKNWPKIDDKFDTIDLLIKKRIINISDKSIEFTFIKNNISLIPINPEYFIYFPDKDLDPVLLLPDLVDIRRDYESYNEEDFMKKVQNLKKSDLKELSTLFVKELGFKHKAIREKILSLIFNCDITFNFSLKRMEWKQIVINNYNFIIELSHMELWIKQLLNLDSNPHSKVWNTYKEALYYISVKVINKQENNIHEKLIGFDNLNDIMQLLINDSNLLSFFNISDLFDFVNEDDLICFSLIEMLPEITKNNIIHNYINWTKIIDNCIIDLTNKNLNFDVKDKINLIEHKTDKIFSFNELINYFSKSVKFINNYENAENFDPESKEYILIKSNLSKLFNSYGGILNNKLDKNVTINDIKILLTIMQNPYIKFYTEDNLISLNTFLKTKDYDLVDEFNTLFNYWNIEDQENFIIYLNALKDVSGVSEFLNKNYDPMTNHFNSIIDLLIYRNKDLAKSYPIIILKLISGIKTISRQTLDNLIYLFENSNEWATLFTEMDESIFDMSDQTYLNKLSVPEIEGKYFDFVILLLKKLLETEKRESLLEWIELCINQIVNSNSYNCYARIFDFIIFIDCSYDRRVFYNSYNINTQAIQNIQSIVQKDRLNIIDKNYKLDSNEINIIIIENLQYSDSDFEIYMKRLEYFDPSKSNNYLKNYKKKLNSSKSRKLQIELNKQISKITDIMFINQIEEWNFFSSSRRKSFKKSLIITKSKSQVAKLIKDRIQKTLSGDYKKSFSDEIDIICSATKKADRQKFIIDKQIILDSVNSDISVARKFGVKIVSHYLTPQFIRNNRNIFDDPRIKNFKDYRYIKNVLR